MTKQKKRVKKFASKIKQVIKRRRNFQKIKERIQRKRKRNDDDSRTEEPSEQNSNISNDQSHLKPQTKSEIKKIPMNVDQFLEDGFFKDLDEPTSSLSEELEEDGSDGDDNDDENVGENENINEKEKSMEQSELESHPQSDLDSDSEDPIDKHKRELAQLAITDPQFYEFLKKEQGGEELLRFGQDDNNDIEQMKSETEENENENESKNEQKTVTEHSVSREERKGMTLTLNTLKKWEEIALKGKSVRTTKRLIGAFRSAARINDIDEEDDNKQSNNSTNKRQRRMQDEIEQFNERRLKSKYKILDGGVFNFIIVTCLKNLGHIFDMLINRDKSKERRGFYPKKYPRWKKISSMVKSYLTNLIHFMNQLTDPNMIIFLLKQTENMLGYFGPFPKLAKKFLKKLLEWWGGATETVRVLAFLNIRRLALDLPFPFIDTCLKGIYLTFVQNAKFTNPKTQPLITFMMNCVVEMYGLDFTCSYQHMFVYLRQLAILLRTAYNNKTKEHYEAVYNWQYINSLRVWTRVLCAFPNQEALSLLIYPLVQIIQGVITLVPTPRYFPLRLQCIRMMNELALYNSNVFVNSLPFALEILEAPEVLKKASTRGTLKPTSLTYTLKIANKLLGTKVYQDALISNTLDVIHDYMSVYSYSIAFPELAIPCVVALKKFAKRCHNGMWRRKVKALLESININSKFIQAKRAMSNIAPNDKLNLNSFLMEEKTNENELTPLMKHRKIFKEVATGKKIENKEQQNRTESKDNQKSNSKIELNKDSNENVENDEEEEEEEENEENEDDSEKTQDRTENVTENVQPSQKYTKHQKKKSYKESNFNQKNKKMTTTESTLTTNEATEDLVTDIALSDVSSDTEDEENSDIDESTESSNEEKTETTQEDEEDENDQ